MSNKKIRARLYSVIVLLLLLIMVLSLTSFVAGKYKQDVTVSGTVTFSANLASEVILREHLAVRQTDGSYELVTREYAQSRTDDSYEAETFTDANTYVLLPGLDIPKDPHIVITGKSEIPAYLYVEVVDTLDTKDGKKPVTYQMSGNWSALGTTGPNGGQVYYYNTVIDDTFTQYPINILTGTVTVSSNLLKQTAQDGEDVLQFHVTLIQRVDNQDPQSTYNR